MEKDKSEGILSRMVAALGGIAASINQIASFIRAQTLSHSHTGGTDGQQLANAAIASNAAIAMTKLDDFSDWADWTPTYTVNGDGSWGSVTTRLAKYTRVGNIVYFIWSGLGTMSGNTTGRQIFITLPIVSNVTTIDYFGGACLINFGSSTRSVGVWFNADGAKIYLQNSDNAIFANAANTGGQIEGFYQVA